MQMSPTYSYFGKRNFQRISLGVISTYTNLMRIGSVDVGFQAQNIWCKIGIIRANEKMLMKIPQFSS